MKYFEGVYLLPLWLLAVAVEGAAIADEPSPSPSDKVTVDLRTLNKIHHMMADNVAQKSAAFWEPECIINPAFNVPIYFPKLDYGPRAEPFRTVPFLGSNHRLFNEVQGYPRYPVGYPVAVYGTAGNSHEGIHPNIHLPVMQPGYVMPFNGRGY